MKYRDYYVLQTSVKAQACIDTINSSSMFPLIPMRQGKPDYEAQGTDKWVEKYRELLTGEFAVLRIPQDRLDNCGIPYEVTLTDEEGEEYTKWDYPGYPQEDQDAFLEVFGQDIRSLSEDELVPLPEEIVE